MKLDKLFTNIINEVRSNPDKNVKEDAFDRLKKYFDDDTIFISFTTNLKSTSSGSYVQSVRDKGIQKAVEYNKYGTKEYERAVSRQAAKDTINTKIATGTKIGLNPQSGYDTPLGVYTYPVKAYVKYKVGRHHADVNSPDFRGEFFRTYQAELPNIYVLRIKPNVKKIADIGDEKEYSKDDLKKDIKNLFKIYVKYMGVSATISRYREYKDLIKDYMRRTASPQSSGRHLWNITRMLSAHLGEMIKGSASRMQKNMRLWNYLLRGLGYEALIDKSTMGIIHSNEPCQAVFLSVKGFDVVDVIENVKRTKENTILSRMPGDKLEKFIQKSFSGTSTKIEEMLNNETEENLRLRANIIAKEFLKSLQANTFINSPKYLITLFGNIYFWYTVVAYFEGYVALKDYARVFTKSLEYMDKYLTKEKLVNAWDSSEFSSIVIYIFSILKQIENSEIKEKVKSSNIITVINNALKSGDSYLKHSSIEKVCGWCGHTEMRFLAYLYSFFPNFKDVLVDEYYIPMLSQTAVDLNDIELIGLFISEDYILANPEATSQLVIDIFKRMYHVIAGTWYKKYYDIILKYTKEDDATCLTKILSTYMEIRKDEELKSITDTFLYKYFDLENIERPSNEVKYIDITYKLANYFNSEYFTEPYGFPEIALIKIFNTAKFRESFLENPYSNNLFNSITTDKNAKGVVTKFLSTLPMEIAITKELSTNDPDIRRMFVDDFKETEETFNKIFDNLDKLGDNKKLKSLINLVKCIGRLLYNNEISEIYIPFYYTTFNKLLAFHMQYFTVHEMGELNLYFTDNREVIDKYQLLQNVPKSCYGRAFESLLEEFYLKVEKITLDIEFFKKIIPIFDIERGTDLIFNRDWLVDSFGNKYDENSLINSKYINLYISKKLEERYLTKLSFIDYMLSPYVSEDLTKLYFSTGEIQFAFVNSAFQYGKELKSYSQIDKISNASWELLFKKDLKELNEKKNEILGYEFIPTEKKRELIDIILEIQSSKKSGTGKEKRFIKIRLERDTKTFANKLDAIITHQSHRESNFALKIWDNSDSSPSEQFDCYINNNHVKISSQMYPDFAGSTFYMRGSEIKKDEYPLVFYPYDIEHLYMFLGAVFLYNKQKGILKGDDNSTTCTLNDILKYKFLDEKSKAELKKFIQNDPSKDHDTENTTSTDKNENTSTSTLPDNDERFISFSYEKKGDEYEVRITSQSHIGENFAIVDGKYTDYFKAIIGGSAYYLLSCAYPDIVSDTLYVRGSAKDKDDLTVKMSKEKLKIMKTLISLYNKANGIFSSNNKKNHNIILDIVDSYKPSIEKKQFIFESPDKIVLSNDLILDYMESDTMCVSFIPYTNIPVVALEPATIHGDFFDSVYEAFKSSFSPQEARNELFKKGLYISEKNKIPLDIFNALKKLANQDERLFRKMYYDYAFPNVRIWVNAKVISQWESKEKLTKEKLHNLLNTVEEITKVDNKFNLLKYTGSLDNYYFNFGDNDWLFKYKNGKFIATSYNDSSEEISLTDDQHKKIQAIKDLHTTHNLPAPWKSALNKFLTNTESTNKDYIKKVLKEDMVSIKKGSLPISKKTLVNTLSTYKKSATEQGFNVKDVKVKEGDIDVANDLIKKWYNFIFEKSKTYIETYIKDKNKKSLLLGFQSLNRLWNKTARADLFGTNIHAPVKIAIMNKLREYNKFIPEIKYTDTNQPIYRFDLIPVFIFIDVLNNAQYRGSLGTKEMETITDALTNKLSLTPDQQEYLKGRQLSESYSNDWKYYTVKSNLPDRYKGKIAYAISPDNFTIYFSDYGHYKLMNTYNLRRSDNVYGGWIDLDSGRLWGTSGALQDVPKYLVNIVNNIITNYFKKHFTIM